MTRAMKTDLNELLEFINNEIEKLNLDWVDKCVILASLIYALDSVDSTLLSIQKIF